MTLIKKKKPKKNTKISTIKQMINNVKKDNPELKTNNDFTNKLVKLIKIKPKSK